MDSQKKKWYALYTKQRWEMKVADHLCKKGIEQYCPVNKAKRQWSDRNKIIYEPIFRSYIFVKIETKDFIKVLQTNGVLNIVYWLNKPAIIQESEIEIIKRFLNEYDQIILEKTDVKVNEIVNITGGAFMDYEGKIIEIKNNYVKVALPSLGYNLVAEVKIQKVAFSHYSKNEELINKIS